MLPLMLLLVDRWCKYTDQSSFVSIELSRTTFTSFRVAPFPTMNIILLPFPSGGRCEPNIGQTVRQMKKEAQIDRYCKQRSVLDNALIDKYGQCPQSPTLAIVFNVWDQILICCHEFIVSVLDIREILHFGRMHFSIGDIVCPPIPKRGCFVGAIR